MGWCGTYDGNLIRLETSYKKRSECPPMWVLNPCPKCGAKQKEKRVTLWGVFANKDNKGWVVICSDCHYTPRKFCSTEQEAVEMWNGGDKNSGCST